MKKINDNKISTILYITPDISVPKGTSIRAKSFLLKFLENDKQVLFFGKGAKKLGIEDKLLFYRDNSTNSNGWIKDVWACFKKAKEHKPDIIYSQTFIASVIGTIFSKLLGVKHILDVHSLVIDDLVYFKNIKKYNPKYLFYYVFERMIYSLGNGLTVVCSGIKEVLNSTNKSIKILRGGVDTKLFNPHVKKDKQVMAIINQSKFEGYTTVIYAGNFRTYQGVFNLFDAIRTLKSKEYHFIFVGDNSKIKHKDFYKELNAYENVEFLGLRASKDIPSILACADILVIPRTSEKINKNAYPSKLTEYMACGKPILATDIGDINKMIINNKTGVLVKSDSSQQLVLGLKKMKNRAFRNKIGANAYKHIMNDYTWEILYSNLMDFMGKVKND